MTTTIQDLIALVRDRVDPAGLLDGDEIATHVRALRCGHIADHHPGDRGQLAALCEAVHLAIDPETEPESDTFRAAFLPAEDGRGEVLLTAPRHAGLPDPLLRAEACAELRRAGLYTDERADLIEIGYWTGRP